MPTVTESITNMQNMTATQQVLDKKGRAPQASTNDSNMFLTLMLKQLESQDPTQPVDNTQWLSQLAQYSSLEQMTNMNKGLTDCMGYLAALQGDMAINAEITQTLSMIGKEVTLKIPDKDDPKKFETVTGKVTEANFEDGKGQVKVGDEYYSIANIVSVKGEGTTAPLKISAAEEQVKK